MAVPETPGLQGVMARISEIQRSARPASSGVGAEPGFALPAGPATQALDRTALGLGATPGPYPTTAPSTVAASSGGPLLHPLNGAGELIGTPHAGTHTLGNWQSDNALDWRVPEGTPIYAVADGVIGPKIGPLSSTESRFAGERLTLESAGDAFYYAHLSEIVVGAGQPVVKGQLLGYSGSANGVPHLHFGQREGDPREHFTSG